MRKSTPVVFFCSLCVVLCRNRLATIIMADAVLLSTCDISTAVSRGPQPQAITLQQIADIERTWKIVEEDIGLLEAGIELFKK